MNAESPDDADVSTTVAAVLYLATRYAMAPCTETAAAVERQLRLLAGHPGVRTNAVARELYARLVAEWRQAATPGPRHAAAASAPSLH